MLRYRFVDPSLPATWRSRAAARFNADCPSGKEPTTRMRRLISRRWHRALNTPHLWASKILLGHRRKALMGGKSQLFFEDGNARFLGRDQLAKGIRIIR